MTELFIVRHGIAVPHGTPGVEEDERPLTPKGRKRRGKVPAGRLRLGAGPDRIPSSPLPRPWQTAEVVASTLEIPDPLKTAEMLRPDRRPHEIGDWLRSF